MRLTVDPMTGMPVMQADPDVRVFSQSGGGGGADSATATALQFDKIPVESPNGVRVSFTVPNGDSYAETYINVFLGGQMLTHVNDFTETSPTTIQFVTAPFSGDIIRFNYRRI